MPTTIVFADAADGYIQGDDSSSTDYTLATTSPTTVTTLATFLLVGQTFDAGTTYIIYQGDISFDTTGLTGATSAILSMVDQSDFSTTDFTLEARLHDWGATLTTADWLTPANIGGKTLVAQYTTATGWTGTVYHDFTDVAMVANLNTTGFTRLLLNSNLNRTAVPPTVDEYINAKSADTAGTTSDPKLTIVTAASTTDYFPVADITDGNWLNELGSNTDLYKSVDESAFSDTDWIQSGDTPNNDVCELLFGDTGTPDTGTITISVRAERVGGGNRFPPWSEPPAELKVTVFEGVKDLHTEYLRFGFGEQTQSFDLTALERSLITDYAGLCVRFAATSTSARMRVTWVKIATPVTLTTIVTTRSVEPIADVTDGSWLNELGSNTDLYASIDENAANDADWIESGAEPIDDACEVKLANAGTPDTGTITIKVRGKLTGGGNRFPAWAEPFAELRVDLVEGSTIRATRYLRFPRGETAEYAALTAGERSAIVGWSDLRLRFTATTSSGRVRVTQAKLLAPADTGAAVVVIFSDYHRRVMLACAA